MNVADSAKLAAGLDLLGHEKTERADEADLVVVNTCVVREHAENRAINKLATLRRLKARRNGVKIVLTGCLVGPQTEELRRRFPYVDLFAPPQAFAQIGDLAGAPCSGEFWQGVLPGAGGPTAYVPVIHGCNKFCSYCIVPYRRGRERSRPVAEVRREVEHLAAGGAREVTLLGQSVEAYGRDLPGKPDLGDLMRALHDIEGLGRIRFLTSYPADLTERVIETVAELPKVCECFSLPLQSGDDDVLARMRRGYTVEQYRTVVEKIKRLMPEAGISTDVIVGFCGESEEQFRRTYGLLERLRFDKVHVASYSPRPGTIAAREMEDDVPPEAKQARLQAVEALEARISGEINAGLVGSVQEVLIEEQQRGKWSGRTRSGKLVHFEGERRPGDLVCVRIERAGPWSLSGTVIGEEAAP